MSRMSGIGERKNLEIIQSEKLGNYSVKSAYVMMQEQKNLVSATASDRFWKRLWALKIPPKVKHLIWRAATGCLPSKTQLRHKHVNIDALCPQCQLEPETITHVLLTCSFARECWYQLRGDMDGNPQASFIDWLSNVFDYWDTKQRQDAAMLCWSLWKCRNELVWNQRGTEVAEVVVSARVVFNQWQHAQDKTFDNFLSHMTNADGIEHWTLPTENMVKINSDAAIFEASNCYSFSLVARNHKGELLHARSKCSMGNVVPENAEAMGVREALSWIKGQQYNNVVVETDCLVVVQALRSSGVLLSYFGRLIDECKKLLNELRDRNVCVNFVKRSANKVADFLARSTCSIADRNWRVCDNHPGFIDVLMNDLIY